MPAKHQGESKSKVSAAAGDRGVSSGAEKSVKSGTSGMSCQVDKLAQQNDEHEWFTLPQSGKCGCSANVKQYVVTSEMWMGSESLALCPMHMGVLFDVDNITVETVRQAARQVDAEAAAQRQAQRSSNSVESSPNRSSSSGVSAAYAAVAAVDQADRLDGNGFRLEGVDRRGQPYGAVSAQVSAAYRGPQQVVDQKLGQYAKSRCSSVVCNDQLSMKVVGDHYVTWFAVCTGRAVNSTKADLVFELFVVSAGRVVSMTAGCLADTTAPWQLTWLGPRNARWSRRSLARVGWVQRQWCQVGGAGCSHGQQPVGCGASGSAGAGNGA